MRSVSFRGWGGGGGGSSGIPPPPPKILRKFNLNLVYTMLNIQIPRVKLRLKSDSLV